MRVDDLLRNAVTHLRHSVEVKAERFRGLKLRLDSLSPRDTLRRGYAIVQRRDDGEVVTDSERVSPGAPVQVTLGRGGFDAEVSSIRGDDGNGQAKETR
jgi:exodeoxyribonuclease VII large subunit